MSYIEEQLRNVDAYGYPLPPTARRRLRKKAVRASRGLIAGALYLLLSCIGALLWLGRRGKSHPPLTPATFHPARILVVRLDLIGDLVLSLTVVRALKRTYPHAEIDLLAIPASARVASFDPALSQVIAYDPNVWRRPRSLLQLKKWREALALLRRMRARRYDLAISVYGNWAALLATASGAGRRVGYGREGYPGFMTDSVPGGIPGRWRHYAPLDHRHEVDYCLELACVAGATLTTADRIPRLWVDEQTRQSLEDLLNAAGARPGIPLVVCHINSNNGQSKRWPIPYWALLLDRLSEREGVQVVLTGAAGDMAQIEAVARQMRTRVPNLAGKTSLTQLAALLQRADLLISGDSGPLHMGVACGTPIIGIYGPTNPALGGPVSPDATVLRSPIWCSPCYNARETADCRFYTTQCMKNILPATVLAAARHKLARRAQLMGRGREDGAPGVQGAATRRE
jgi:lipopolysaccharide heptosyltransferase II